LNVTMPKKTRKDYAAEGIETSARTKESGWMTQYVRGHGQWVKGLRMADTRHWLFARGWSGEVTARQGWSISSIPTWDDAMPLR
jgi:hypothetical protein